MTNPAMTRVGLALVNATDPADDTPLPGVYPGVSMVTYHRWPGASNSRMTKLRQSAAHLKAYMDEPTPDAAHFAQGRAIHSAILEPDDFAGRYVVAERCTAIKKDKERCNNSGIVCAGGEWFCGVHGKGLAGLRGPTVLSGADHTLCLRARDAVYAHPKARKLLTGKGMVELSAIWKDKVNGVGCKARFDRFSADFGAIPDIKSTVNASRDAFERAIYGYGYHRQGAHYLDGAEATGLQAGHFVIIAVEKEPPYAVAVYRLDEATIEAGRATLRPLLDRYKQCIDTDTWPGYSENIEDIAIPAYGFQQADTEMREAANV